MKQRIVSLNPDGDWVPTVYKREFIDGFDPDPELVESGAYGPSTKTYHMRESSFIAVDERCSESGTGRRVWHPFSHWKRVSLPTATLITDVSERTVMNTPFSGQYQCYVGEPQRTVDMFNCSQFGVASNPTVGMPAMFSISVDGDLVVADPPELDLLLGAAFQRLLPGIRPDLSLINSILELKDFKSLVETFSQMDSILARQLSLNNLQRAAFQNLSFREILRRRSSDYLQLKFNLQPLYSDIKGALRLFKSYQAQLMRLLAQAEKVNTRHSTIGFAEYAGEPTFESTDWHSPGLEFSPEGVQYQLNRQTRSHRKVTYAPSKFHLEMEIQYSFDKVQKQHAALFAVMDGLGVNLNPAIIWNATRWTFVVDWILGVGKFLDSFKRRQLEPVVNIRRCLWSVKRSRSIECSFDLLNGPAANPASTCTETAYRRSLCMPTPASLRASGLTLTEVSLGAALVFSRRPRTRQP
jgi:hypothetical protein